jgi:HEAT repeat protein
LPAQLEAIKSKEWDTRSEAASALGGLKNDPASAPSAVAAQMATLKDQHPRVRSLAARTLGEFGPAAKDAVPRLIEMLEDQASTEITLPKPKHPLSAKEQRYLDEALAMMKRGEVRFEIPATLGKIGPGARAAVPALVKQARLKDREAIRALGSIGPDAADAAAPVLAGYLKESPISFDAAPALARMGGAGAVALVKALKDDKTEYVAREALERGGRGVVGALVKGLGDDDAAMRKKVAGVLGKIGPAAWEALPTLRTLLRSDPDRGVQDAVAGAIREIGPGR